jgi:hypothetical protein
MATNAVLAVQSNSPYVWAKAFTPGTGWGANLTGPSGLPSGSYSAQAIAYDPKTNICVFAINANSTVTIKTYRMTTNGFGTALADGPSFSVLPTAFTFHPTLPIVVVALGNSSPYLKAYTFDDSGWGAALTNSTPASPPARESQNRGVWLDSGSTFITAHTISPYVAAYAFNSNGFGSKYADPSTLPQGHGSAITTNLSKTTVIHGNGTSSYGSFYPWNNGFGTRYTNLIATAQVSNIFMQPSGSHITTIAAGAIRIYPWTDSTPPYAGSQVSSTGYGTAPATYRQGDMSPEGTDLVVGTTTTPYVKAYAWSTNDPLTQYSNPASLPNAAARETIFVTLPSFKKWLPRYKDWRDS